MPRTRSTLYTGTGDAGVTGLADGTRLDKDAPRIACIGTVDELNSALGVLLGSGLEPDLADLLTPIQHRLFDLGAELALSGSASIRPEQVADLEQSLDRLDAALPRLKAFILPGGNPAAAHCHLARAVCRRAERELIALGRDEAINPHARRYLNRLSDLLFVVARTLNRRAESEEVRWRPDPDLSISTSK